MNKDEALKLAMEGLEWIHRVSAMDYEYQQKALDTLNAIYKTLAQTEQAPMNYYRADAEGNLERTDIHFAQSERKTVAVNNWPSAAIGKETLQDALKRENGTPPQRTWVGLSDAEVKKIVGSDRYTDLLLEVVNFVEAKLKEKNCG